MKKKRQNKSIIDPFMLFLKKKKYIIAISNGEQMIKRKFHLNSRRNQIDRWIEFAYKTREWNNNNKKKQRTVSSLSHRDNWYIQCRSI